MREILFRGQTRKKGEKVSLDGTPVDSNWVYGGVAQFNEERAIIYQTEPEFHKFAVYAETLGQFTGLSDCINNAIFEGDLVRAFDGKECEFDQSYIGIVKFVGGLFGVEWHANNFQSFIPFRDIESNIMLVGNIFDNPEMLKCETPLENYIDRICLMCSKKCNEYLESGVDLYKHKVRILRDENRELKKILKVAINDLDYAMNVGKCAVCSNSCCEANSICKWKYKEEAEKLLKGE